MIPARFIDHVTRRSGVVRCVDTLYVQHVDGQLSTLEFKAYEQGRIAFQGVPITGGIWLDEEPPDPSTSTSGSEVTTTSSDIYTECLLRLLATDGLLISTFTPLRGLTPFVKEYLETAVMIGEDGRSEVPAATGFWPGAKEVIQA